MNDQELSEQIRELAQRHPAPQSLRAGLRSNLALAAVLQARKPRRPALALVAGWRDAVFSGPRMVWSSAVSGFALGILSMALMPVAVDRLGLASPDETDVTTSHVRALRAGPLVEVVSTDRHTVKPWFQGKLDFAPPVLDLTDEGFPLKGGRVENLNRTKAAGLVYSRNLHVIDMYIWPTTREEAISPATVRGFNTLQWAQGGMQYWLVSDVDRHELERFSQIWREKAMGR